MWAAVLILLSVICVLVGIHWYLWRRLVRDVSRAGSGYRRAGAAAVVLLPLTSIGAMMVGQAGLPFRLVQVLAWPGYFWFALMVYLLLALLVSEPLRPLLNRWVRRRATRAAVAKEPTAERGGATEAPEPVAVAAPGGARRADGPDRSGGYGPPGPAGGGAAGAAEPADTGPADAGSPAGSGRPGEPSRRLFVARSAALAAATVAVGTVGYGAAQVFAGPSVKRITVPLATLPRAGHGFRIAVVSDIHIGPLLGRAHTQRIVDTINRTQPDLVAIVGDLVDGSVPDLGTAAEPLAALQARHGAYFVTGNHEYFSGAGQWIDYVAELGVRPLENARDELPAFDLVGVNDVAGTEEGHGPDFDAALAGRDPSRTSVLLAHQPVQIHQAVEHGVDLQLSGHTHGGQMWPGNYLAELANPTVAGLERYGDTQLYVTRGAGTWGPPVRVGAEPDITVVELASGRV